MGKHFFRALRPDEDVKILKAKDPHREFPTDPEGRRLLIQEHVKYGSSPGYRSPWLSLTADLNVALAFAGPVARVAFVRIEDLQLEKRDSEVKWLDKENLQRLLTEKVALARSRRSDEVLVFKELGCAHLLEITLAERPVRILAPGFEQCDSMKFPAPMQHMPRAYESIGGSNKRMFRVIIAGKRWIALLPRPNYSLDAKVLFGRELVQLAKHQGQYSDDLLLFCTGIDFSCTSYFFR